MMQTRRFFLKTSLVSTAIFTVACTQNETTDVDSISPLKILKLVQTDLFPQNAVENANAYRYLSVILNHSLVTDSDKKYLRNGVKWLNEEAVFGYSKSYLDLSASQRQDLLKTVAKVSWGRSWIKTVLTYIMESALGDPIYGVNKNETGWKWVQHEAGLPRPKEALL